MAYIGSHSRVLPTRYGTSESFDRFCADNLDPDATCGPDHPLPVRSDPGARDAAPATPSSHRSGSASSRAPGGLAGDVAYSAHLGAG